MAKILIGNVKPVKGVDYFTPADIEELGNTFAKKEDVPDLTLIQEEVDTLTTSVEDTQKELEETNEKVDGMESKFAPAYTYGTEDLEAGVTPLETGKLHFVYE